MSKLVSNNTYSNILQVSWDDSNKYIAKTEFSEDSNGDEIVITTWQTNSKVLAKTGQYLSIDKNIDSTYIIKLLNLTFNEGVLTGGTVNGTLYKLSSDFSFKDSEPYYVKNNNNFEELKVNQGQCIFTTDPTTNNNFYIYQKGIEPWTSAPPLPRLVYYYSGTKWYYPLITKTGTLTWNGYIYSYDKSIGDTFGVALNNTKYVVPNKRVAAYDIAPGTYTPSTFQNLIKSFISNNGSRAVSNSFSVTVNGQTLSLAAGTRIWYVTQGSSPWYARAVCFGVSWFEVASCQSSNGFSGYKAYIVETSPSNSYSNDICFNRVFKDYAYYNITVSTGIKFE